MLYRPIMAEVAFRFVSHNKCKCNYPKLEHNVVLMSAVD